MEKVKYRYLLLVIFLMFAFGMPTAKAATTGHGESRAKVWMATDQKEELGRWGEGILKVDGQTAFCIDYKKHFKNDTWMDEYDALEFLSRGRDRKEAQDFLTKIALYNDYFKNNNNLNDEQKYFFAQAMIWTALGSYYDDWDGKFFWIEAWQEINMPLFPCKTPGDECMEPNTIFENKLNDEAEEHYQKNKNKFIGEGKIFDNGVNQPLIQLSVKENQKYNYSIDAACVGCGSKNKNNIAYVIQDTTNWQAIAASKEVNEVAKKYFYKDKEETFYCREEYIVKLPNATNIISVQTGRYFTVNADESIISLPFSAPDLRPIEVTKKRQCGGDLSKLDRTGCRLNTDSKKAGTLKLIYTENSKKKEIDLEGKVIGEPKVSNATDMEVKYSYTLDNDTYRMIRKSDGKSVNYAVDLKDKAYDLGVGNIPVSFENNNVKSANVEFKYELPTGDSCSQIAKAYGNSGYFGEDSSKEKTAYTEYPNSLDGEPIDQSACVKLYGSVDAAQNCINEHKRSNSNSRTPEKCNYKNTKNKYECPVIKAKCTQVKTEGKTTYYDENGQEVQKEDFAKKCCNSEDDAKGFGLKWDGKSCELDDDICTQTTKGRSWNPVDGRCCDFGETYNEVTKSCESIPNKRKYCEDVCCCPSGCEGMYFGPNGEVICPGPGLGGIKLIYRTIDLKYPFPGINGGPGGPQANKGRDTGSNWCSYNLTGGGILTCKNTEEDNIIVKKVIFDKNDSISKEEYMYKVKLDKTKIKNIRRDYGNKKYDDFTLSCEKGGKYQGQKCTSDFVKTYATGPCVDVSKDKFETCKGVN